MELTICPRCNRPVTASEYMNPAFIGALESVLPTITCPCGYNGLPVKVSFEDYKKLLQTK